ncbi:UNVERIFIED_CONTAM: hypothetical protein HHA_453110 [Hammondia hammondi]|eukprot:XP_008886380.1 hypothetical protein HHA_453110 [Hammondia hammondi]
MNVSSFFVRNSSDQWNRKIGYTSFQATERSSGHVNSTRGSVENTREHARVADADRTGWCLRPIVRDGRYEKKFHLLFNLQDVMLIETYASMGRRIRNQSLSSYLEFS